jgi:hypothetical protein
VDEMLAFMLILHRGGYHGGATLVQLWFLYPSVLRTVGTVAG